MPLNKQNFAWLPMTFRPGSNDVIVGRGKVSYRHDGNLRLAKLVRAVIQEYSSATKQQKSDLIKEIMKNVYQSSPEGGFVKHDCESQRWYQVSRCVAREKVSQAFRDASSSQYRSSTASKIQQRKEKRLNPASSGSSSVSSSSNHSEATNKMPSIHPALNVLQQSYSSVPKSVHFDPDIQTDPPKIQNLFPIVSPMTSAHSTSFPSATGTSMGHVGSSHNEPHSSNPLLLLARQIRQERARLLLNYNNGK